MPETCEHSWSCEKPWSYTSPGPCVKCGAPRPEPIVAYLREAAEHFIRPRLPMMAAELEDFTGRLAAALTNAGKVNA